jgi:L-fucose mutarotase/ribose pyranase (RbsD/FucU family)
VLKYQLLHPEILRGLGEAGHGAQVLIAEATIHWSRAHIPVPGMSTSIWRLTWSV